jgi:hypothetical protein
MNADDRMRFAAGETDSLPPAPETGLSEDEAVRKDMSYSPASDTETERKQQDPLPDAAAEDDIDTDAVRAVPGTGGPDDTGDVEVDPDDLNLPFRDA